MRGWVFFFYVAFWWLVAPRHAGLVDVGGMTSGPRPRFAGPAGRLGYQPLAIAESVPLRYTWFHSPRAAWSGSLWRDSKWKMDIYIYIYTHLSTVYNLKVI